MQSWTRTRLLLLFIAGTGISAGCPGDDTSEDTATEATSVGATDPSTSTTATPTSTTMSSASTSASSTSSSQESSSGEPGSESGGSSAGSSGGGSTGSTTGPGTTGGSSSGTGSGQTILDCGNQTYACGDLEDNDGDGFIDLFDPECTGPCDDDESSFATGIPGDNMDCIQDCFFDGNSGQGEGCSWDLRCDPENPGANIGCEYNGGGPQCNGDGGFSKECIEFCNPLTPPGCDCFGCCTVQTDEGAVDIFLNGDEECSLDNIEACETCTSQIDECGNPCEPQNCELCFGETELPPECDENTCDVGSACDVASDCAEFEYCYLGCCYPLPG